MLLAFLFVLSLSSVQAFGQSHQLPFEVIDKSLGEQTLDPYLTIGNVRLERLDEAELKFDFNTYENKGFGEAIMIVDQLVALGKKIWPIIEAGRPVITTKFAPVYVLPVQVLDDQNLVLDSWSTPKVARYKVVYENLFGMDVITFTFSVQYQAEGQLDGVGKYLSGVYVSADNVSVSWGFDFDAKTVVTAITNRGTLENPVAGLTLRLEYVAKSVLREIRSTASFHVTGNGTFQKL